MAQAFANLDSRDLVNRSLQGTKQKSTVKQTDRKVEYHVACLPIVKHPPVLISNFAKLTLKISNPSLTTLRHASLDIIPGLLKAQYRFKDLALQSKTSFDAAAVSARDRCFKSAKAKFHNKENLSV